MAKTRGLLVGLIALPAVLFGLSCPAGAVATPPLSMAVSYSYAAHHSGTDRSSAASERGPPEIYDDSTTYDADVPLLLGAVMCPNAPTASATCDYDALAQSVQIPHGSDPAEQRVGAGDSGSLVAQRSGVAANAGPGAWGTAAECMSSLAAAYQSRITGRSAGSVYYVNGVKFDGFANGVLQEAKGPGYADFVRNGQFQPWFSGADGLVSQAQRQLAAAGGTPIKWSVAEGPAASAINNLFVSRGISGINVMHVP